MYMYMYVHSVACTCTDRHDVYSVVDSFKQDVRASCIIDRHYIRTPTLYMYNYMSV